MAKSFAITAAKETCKLDSARNGEASFTVTNTSSRSMRGQLKLKPLGTTQAAWLSLGGDSERDFKPTETQQATVKIAVPSSAAAGKYTFRLDAVSVANPDDDFAEGPAVAVEVPAAQPVGVKPFPWWIVAVAVLVLLVGGGAVWWIMNRPPPDVLVTDVVTPPLTFEKAEEALKAQGLTVTRQDEPNNAKPPGEVLKQDPAAKASVKKGSAVVLTVAVTNQVPVPKVVSSTEAAARQDLEAKGFKKITVTHEAILPTVAQSGTVASQTPNPGTMAAPESQAVALVIADEGVQVPRVVGSSNLTAQIALAGVGLPVTTVKGDNSNQTAITNDSKVTGTDPIVGKVVKKETEMTLIVAAKGRILINAATRATMLNQAAKATHVPIMIRPQ